MTQSETENIIQLQHRIRIRLSELGFAPSTAASNLERHLAHIAVLSRTFTENTLPLFLSLSGDHQDSIASVAVSIKTDLDELRDALTDAEPDLIELMRFLNPHLR